MTRFLYHAAELLALVATLAVLWIAVSVYGAPL